MCRICAEQVLFSYHYYDSSSEIMMLAII
uniref:Uncharacterized protein n=1 Tax=Anguilla anguilla TaxID=7936 RepID=A0A0E9PA68_ANGAN